MCPFVPSALLLDINTFSSDEDYVIYLIKRRTGDPLPKNVSTDINPFLIEPQDSSENTWYLCLKGVNGESSMRKTENGFWKEINKIEISFNGNIGWKNTLEFYEGAMRTGFMMLEYHIKPNLEGVSNSDIQDYSSLCRIFWQNERSSNFIEQQNLLAHLSDKNELSPAPSLRELSNNNNTNNDNSFIELNDLLSSSETEIISKKSENNNTNNNNNNNAYCDFSNRDYLELKDILSSDSGSTSSGNSSRMSGEYFDPDEWLREIAGDCNPDLLQGMEREGEGSVNGPIQLEERVNSTGPVQSEQRFGSSGDVQFEESFGLDGAVQFDGRFSVAGPVQTEQVLIRPEPDLVPVPDLHNFILNENTQNEGPSTSRTSRTKRNLSEGTSSNSSSSNNNCNSNNNNNNNDNNNSNNSKSPTQRERKRNNVIRLAKLGRKLFCFAGF